MNRLILFFLLVSGVAQSQVMQVIRGGTRTEFNTGSIPTGYALIEKDGRFSFYKRLTGLHTANDTIVDKSGTFWQVTAPLRVNESAVRAVKLAGFSTASAAAVTSASTVLGALGQLQGQINDLTANRLKKLRFSTFAAITGLPANEEVFVIVLVDETNGDKKTYYMWDGYNNNLQWIPTVDAN